MDDRIYCDNNATTRVAPKVLEAMLPFYGEHYGNASSVHAFGREAKAALDLARGHVASLIGAEPNEIVFVSGGTESDNLAIQGVIHSSPRPEKHIITSKIEHHAVWHSCRAMEKEGVRVTYLDIDSRGIVDPTDVEAAITPNTLLISIMLANNETGTLEPLEIISSIAQKKQIKVHTDAVQAIGKISVKVDTLGVDLLSLSGHKLHAPKGIGALYLRKGTRLSPLLHGGGHERNRRAGTENIAQIAGLGKACEMADQGLAQNAQFMRELRDSFEEQVFRLIPDVHRNGDPHLRLPNTSNLRFSGVDGEGLLINLDLAGVACSTGSACTSGSIDPSHVLSAMGLSRQEALGAVRFSFSKYNHPDEVRRLVKILAATIERLRGLRSLASTEA
jgi:cysteine desulfurase